MKVFVLAMLFPRPTNMPVLIIKVNIWFATSGYQSCPIFNFFFEFYSSIWPKEGSHDVGFNIDPKFKDIFVVNNYVKRKATTTSIYDSKLWIPFELYLS